MSREYKPEEVFPISVFEVPPDMEFIVGGEVALDDAVDGLAADDVDDDDDEVVADLAVVGLTTFEVVEVVEAVLLTLETMTFGLVAVINGFGLAAMVDEYRTEEEEEAGDLKAHLTVAIDLTLDRVKVPKNNDISC